VPHAWRVYFKFFDVGARTGDTAAAPDAPPARAPSRRGARGKVRLGVGVEDSLAVVSLALSLSFKKFPAHRVLKLLACRSGCARLGGAHHPVAKHCLHAMPVAVVRLDVHHDFRQVGVVLCARVSRYYLAIPAGRLKPEDLLGSSLSKPVWGSRHGSARRALPHVDARHAPGPSMSRT
jgi:hypothetical protein